MKTGIIVIFLMLGGALFLLVRETETSRESEAKVTSKEGVSGSKGKAPGRERHN